MFNSLSVCHLSIWDVPRGFERGTG